MHSVKDIQNLIERRGYKALYLANEFSNGMLPFLIFSQGGNDAHFKRWHIHEWILSKDLEFLQCQVDTMLLQEFNEKVG